MHKTHTCGELRNTNAGEQVTLAGWVNRRRDHGGLIFIDLRDRFGLVQLVADPVDSPEAHAALEPVRNEWVLQIIGKVRNRPDEMVNPDLETGAIEIEVEKVNILNEAKTPPFMINKEEDIDENLRLKYRYLDLRRERMSKNIVLRHKAIKFIRDYLDDQGFIEVETPILFKTTPEGARDYLVPSRVHPGKVYALPQSPQQLKQLLMVAGVEKYFQIARCFRDEDQRGDRQPEFTQLDLEMSFVEREDVMELTEEMFSAMVLKLAPEKKMLQTPWPVFTYKEVMNRFGSDKPDIRFGLELVDIADVAEGCGFGVFENTLKSGGSVRGINAKGLGGYSRKKIDALTEYVKQFKAKGLAYLAVTHENEVRSSFAKFLSEDKLKALKEKMGAESGDLLLFVADKEEVVFDALGRLRIHLGDILELRDPNILAFCWVIDFPFAFWSEEEQRWDPSHHLFTSPMPEDKHLIDTEPEKMRGTQYDLALNNYEVAGGSIRIHEPELQEKVFKLIGLDPEVARERFGHMLEAFEYGAPPHGGIAPGIDRLVMILAGEDNIREVIAFPKNQAARDLMADAPSDVTDEQYKDLHIKHDIKKED